MWIVRPFSFLSTVDMASLQFLLANLLQTPHSHMHGCYNFFFSVPNSIIFYQLLLLYAGYWCQPQKWRLSVCSLNWGFHIPCLSHNHSYKHSILSLDCLLMLYLRWIMTLCCHLARADHKTQQIPDSGLACIPHQNKTACCGFHFSCSITVACDSVAAEARSVRDYHCKNGESAALVKHSAVT